MTGVKCDSSTPRDLVSSGQNSVHLSHGHHHHLSPRSVSRNRDADGHAHADTRRHTRRADTQAIEPSRRTGQDHSPHATLLQLVPMTSGACTVEYEVSEN